MCYRKMIITVINTAVRSRDNQHDSYETASVALSRARPVHQRPPRIPGRMREL
jgi:hypothetical protein